MLTFSFSLSIFHSFTQDVFNFHGLFDKASGYDFEMIPLGNFTPSFSQTCLFLTIITKLINNFQITTKSHPNMFLQFSCSHYPIRYKRQQFFLIIIFFLLSCNVGKKLCRKKCYKFTLCQRTYYYDPNGGNKFIIHFRQIFTHVYLTPPFKVFL